MRIGNRIVDAPVATTSPKQQAGIREYLRAKAAAKRRQAARTGSQADEVRELESIIRRNATRMQQLNDVAASDIAIVGRQRLTGRTFSQDERREFDECDAAIRDAQRKLRRIDGSD